MNYQSIIDNLHWIIAAFALLIAALPALFNTLGKLFKGEDFFERNATKVKWFADQFASARNWYSEAQEKMGQPKIPGLDKAAEVEKLALEAWTLWTSGKHTEALAKVASYQAGAVDKLKKAGLALPFASAPSPTTPTPPAAAPSVSPDNDENPDPTTELENTSASEDK